MPFAIVRPSAVYGPTNNNRSVLKIFVENAIRAEPIVVSNPGTTFLDFTYVKDLANGLALVTLCPEAVNVDLNLTRGEGRSLGEAVGILRGFFPDLKVNVKTESGTFRPIRGSLDISRARQLVGYDSRFSLEDGLAEYIAFVREYNPSLARQLFPTRGGREAAPRTNC
jgi:nucleoside-diphosphate-sugar epimerase